ncbi:hypothetical protein [Pyxidicoccus xibeiensis]|uniref:hypothetical protein n=1 Tax=Pyxidicoccus xibeiensis TaxID=2906759 RepID=UPI0020A749A4|nr:hypothetical protein [Pyxidicoccus xibeiensis]MCP3143324.1 hypothetical protein [Pyxidicoccus xibeiensis]
MGGRALGGEDSHLTFGIDGALDTATQERALGRIDVAQLKRGSSPEQFFAGRATKESM